MTCCVTAEAERKSRQLVNRLAAGGRPVVVAGCAAAYRPEQFEARGRSWRRGQTWVRPFGSWPAPATGRVGAGAGDVPGAGAVADVGAARRRRAGARRPRTRLTLKAQDGCSCPAPTAPCAWCAGRCGACRWGRPSEAARAGLAAGCGEVVLSGINLGALPGPRRRRPGGAGRRPLRAAGAGSVCGSRPSSRVHLREPLLEALAHPESGSPPARAAAVGRRRRACGHAAAVRLRRVRRRDRARARASSAT